jgi:hypothetical protein
MPDAGAGAVLLTEQVARAVREAPGTAVRLVALTGYGQPDDGQRTLAAGFDVFLTKAAEAGGDRTRHERRRRQRATALPRLKLRERRGARGAAYTSRCLAW